MSSDVTEPNSVKKIGIQKAFSDDEYKNVPRTNENGEKNPFQCGICGLIICNKWNFTLHMRVHNNDRRYKCDQCSASFITSHDLKRHKLGHEGTKPRFKCRFCPKSFSSSHFKYLHEDTHDVKLNYKCRHCSETFSKFIERKTHEREFHVKDGSFFNCSECSKKFTSKSFLETHLKNFHKKEEGGFRCHQCDLLFETSLNLNIHRRIHIAETNIHRRTNIAETIVIGKEDSLGYEKKDDDIVLKKKNPIEVDGIRYYECIICTERYTSRPDMIAHMSDTHPVETKAIFKFACELCGKTFRKKQGLLNHLIIHNGEKKFSCTMCEYKSKRSADLKVHMRKHVETPYVCEKCGRRFKEIKSFQQHKKIHVGKAFKCNICDNSFNKLNELDWHKKKRHGDGFKCNICGKLLANPYILKGHIKRRHEKSDKSEEDSNKVNNPTGPKKRKRNVKKDPLKIQAIKKRFECSVCGFLTYSEPTMRQHEDSHDLDFSTSDFAESSHEVYHNIMDVCNKSKVQIDTGTNFEDERKTETIRLHQFLKILFDKSDSRGVLSLPSSSSSNSVNSTFFRRKESLNFSDDDVLDNHLCSNSMLETLKSNIVVINGKKYISIDELELNNMKFSAPCLKSLLKFL